MENIDTRRINKVMNVIKHCDDNLKVDQEIGNINIIYNQTSSEKSSGSPNDNRTNIINNDIIDNVTMDNVTMDNDEIIGNNIISVNIPKYSPQFNSVSTQTNSRSDNSTNSSRNSTNITIKKSNISRFNNFFERNSLPMNTYDRIKKFEDFNIYFLIDDTKSMNKIMKDIGMSRWQDQKKRVSFLFNLLNCFHNININFFFINNGYYLNITDRGFIDSSHLFENPNPNSDKKHLSQTLFHIYENIESNSGSKNNMIFIFTDGLPENNDGNTTPDTLKQFYNIVMQKPINTYISISLLSNNQYLDQYFKNISNTIGGVSVIRSFNYEKHKPNNIIGMNNYIFSDYMIYTLLVPYYMSDVIYQQDYYITNNKNNFNNDDDRYEKGCRCIIM
jgi:hypothetical protein